MVDPKLITVTGKTPPTVRRAPDYKVYYANQSRMRMSNSDFQLFFGMLVDEPGSESLFNDEMLSVLLAPSHAKLVAQGLTAAIEAYELQFGEIKLPADSVKLSQTIHSQILEAARQAISKGSKTD
jgi:hypothetical protein